MIYSVNEKHIRKRPNDNDRTQAEALQFIKDGGFDAVDITLPSAPCEREALVYDTLKSCDSIGLKVNQTHAPFFENRPMPEDFPACLLDSVKKTSELGADVMVVHGDAWYKERYSHWNYCEVLNSIYEVYAPVVEKAEKLGVCIAFETLFETMGTLYHRMRFSSFVEEVDDLVMKFDSPHVGVCWDFGHAAMAYMYDQFEAMNRLKSKIIATHIHDNIEKCDSHGLPYQGYVNWDKAMQTLALKGYEGDFTLELGYGYHPDELVADYVRYARKTVGLLGEKFLRFSAK